MAFMFDMDVAENLWLLLCSASSKFMREEGRQMMLQIILVRQNPRGGWTASGIGTSIVVHHYVMATWISMTTMDRRTQKVENEGRMMTTLPAWRTGKTKPLCIQKYLGAKHGECSFIRGFSFRR